MIQHALSLSKMGLFVFPLTARNKTPRKGIKWKQASTTDEAQIKSWWQQWPDSNIGIDCGKSGLLVIDIDHKNGGDWSVVADIANGQSLVTPTAETGNGFHLYFKQPDGQQFGNANSFPKGIDTRGQGGYVVAPGSIHPNGKQYKWVDNLEPGTVRTIPLPGNLWPRGEESAAPTSQPALQWDVDALQANDYSHAALDNELQALATSGKGNRNNQLNASAFSLAQLVAGGELYESEVRSGLMAVATSIGLNEREINRTLDSAFSKGRLQPRQVPDKQNGHHPAGQPATKSQKTKKAKKRIMSADLLQFLNDAGYSFRQCELDDKVEVNKQPITDAVRAEIRCLLADSGFKREIKLAEDAYLAEAARNSYHPIKDYLEGLKWDGNADIGVLASYFSDEYNLFREYLRRFLVGAVAKVYEGYQNPMLVLDGRQDLGKSEWAKWLCSGLPKFFIESAINPEDKDHHLRLISKFIWEVDELGATTRKADREALKSFVTKGEVTVRAPFARDDMTKPALASMIGTINNEAGFLNDPTGSRRFHVITLTKLDWDYVQCDVNQVWAEAYNLYKEGYEFRLDKQMKAQRDSVNSEYNTESAVVDLFHIHFDFDLDYSKGTDHRMATAEILTYMETMGLKGNQKANMMELAAYLKMLGIKKGRWQESGKQQSGWLGVRHKFLP